MMRVKTWLMAGCALALLTPLGLRAEDKKPHSAITPAVKDKGRHDKFVQIAKRGDVDVLFLGDSITDAWGGEGHSGDGSKIFEKEFKPLKAANFGIGGDQTQHVLWRLQNGELEGIQPKVVMLMIGTNNLGGNKPEEIADGITAIVKEIHNKSPKTKVLLLGIFPRGESAKDGNRKKIAEINETVSKLDDGGKTVKYLDIGKKFVEEDGSLTKKVMPDFLHLSAEGYQRWADAVKGPIMELMGK